MQTKLPLAAGWAAAALLGLFVVVSHAQNAPPPGAPARFQIFLANQSVFRLDTETGETTLYREGYLPEGTRQFRYAYWQHVDDTWLLHDPVEEARQVLSTAR